MTVNKLSLPAKQNAVQQKINEIIDNLGTATGANVDLSNLSSTGENHFQKPLIAGDNISIDSVTPITLPSGYTQLTYIESSGSQYINTGWTYSATYPIQIDCKFAVGSFSAVSGSYPTVYGLQNSGYANWIYPLYIHNGNFMSYLGGSSSLATMPCSLNRVYDTSFTINNGTWSRTINGTINSGSWTGSISTTDNLYLFAGSAGGSVINQLVGKIYSFKITVNNTVVRNYVPCKRNSDGVGGMYDLATSTFKPSETGAFLLGAEVTSGGEVISAIVPPPTTYNFHGVDFYSTDATNVGTIGGDCNSLVSNGHFYYTSNGPSGLGEQSTDGALYVQAYNASWVTQIAQDYRTGELYTRSKKSGTWMSWKAIEYKINKTTSITSTSTDGNYPSAKAVLELLKTIYPVGSIYLSTNSTCPLASLFGTWTLISGGYALWTGNGTSGSGVTANADYANAPANTTIAEGIPNLTGTWGGSEHSENPTANGIFGKTKSGTSPAAGDGSNYKITINASNISSVYNSSTTVQPPAYVVNVWRRTA